MQIRMIKMMMDSWSQPEMKRSRKFQGCETNKASTWENFLLSGLLLSAAPPLRPPPLPPPPPHGAAALKCLSSGVKLSLRSALSSGFRWDFSGWERSVLSDRRKVGRVLGRRRRRRDIRRTDLVSELRDSVSFYLNNLYLFKLNIFKSSVSFILLFYKNIL